MTFLPSGSAYRTSLARCTSLALVAAALLALPAAPQNINTVVGNAFNNGRLARSTPLVKPQGLVVDSSNNLVIADRGSFVVRRVAASTGTTTVIAGGGDVFDDAVPVPGTEAALDYPMFLAQDNAGNVYFSDYNNHRVRRVSPDGKITTIAGTGEADYAGDGGPANQAQLYLPRGLAFDSSRNVLYIADYGSSVIRKIDLTTGTISRYAGTPWDYGYRGDNGPALQASLGGMFGLAVDNGGNLFVADEGFNVIRKIAPSGIITTVVSGSNIYNPYGLAVGPDNLLYFSLWGNQQVGRLETDGSLTLIAGNQQLQTIQDGVRAVDAPIYLPTGLTFDRAGNLYISDEGWNMVFRVDSTGTLRIVAGTLDVLDGGPALNAPLSFPIGAAANSSALFIADWGHHRIRRVSFPITSASTITTIAGTGIPANSDDGPAATRTLYFPLNVSVDSRGNIYICEQSSVVRKIDASTGNLARLAGVAGEEGYSGDGGPARQAVLNTPFAAVADSSGNVYISDWNNHCIRRVGTDGVIQRFAGTCTQAGYAGDGGPALQAKFERPTFLWLDEGRGFLYVSDSENNVVRRINLSSGNIERVAGVPDQDGYSGDEGSPLQAQIGHPNGIYVDSSGLIFIADGNNHVVRVIANGIINTVAGVGIAGFANDGLPAPFAFLNTPTSLARDPAGNFYIVDTDNNRIRRVELPASASPHLAVLPASLSFSAAQGGAPPAAQSIFIGNANTGSMKWTAATSGGNWLVVPETSGFAPSALKVGVNPAGLAPGTYNGSVTITAAGATGSPVTVNVTFTVQAALPPGLGLPSQFLTFEAIQGAAAPPPQLLSITNTGSGTLNWSSQFISNRGGSWLTIAPSTGSVTAGGPASTPAISVNPAGLSSGLYLGLLNLTNQSTNNSTPVAVSLQVAPAATNITLSQNTFVFSVAQGSTAVPNQLMQVFNTGQGTMNWQLQTVVSGGNWLKVSPTSGSSSASAPASSPIVNVDIDPTGLQPGVYGGLIVVAAQGARNSPQFATVVLRVLPQNSAPIPTVQPAGVLLLADVSGATVAQDVLVQTSGGNALTFTAGARTRTGGNWLTVSPTSGALNNSADRAKVRIQAAPGTLAAGVYLGAVTFSFGAQTAQEVAVAMIVRPPGTSGDGPVSLADGKPAAACSPTEQVLLSTRLGNNFALPTGWAVPVTAQVNNNCGAALTGSSVSATFTNGDPAIVLQHLRDGIYTNTWVPTRVSSTGQVQVTMRSLHTGYQEKTLDLTGSVATDITAANPVVNDGGVVNGASFDPLLRLSPGGIFSLFGINLASGNNLATSVPLPTSLGGVSVKIGDYNAPLFYAGPNQINGQIPFQLEGLTSAAVVVTARGIPSAQRIIKLDATQPGIFKVGAKQAAVLLANTDVLAAPAGSIPGRTTRAVKRGDYISIYCTGLGPVTNAPATGSPANPSGNPLSTTTTVPLVKIGGIDATPIFSGLAPGFVALYQVNVQVPANAPVGNEVKISLSMNGVSTENIETTIAIE